MVSQICTLWPLRFRQEFVIFRRKHPEYPDIPSVAHFGDCCFTSNSFLSLMQPVGPNGYPPTAVG